MHRMNVRFGWIKKNSLEKRNLIALLSGQNLGTDRDARMNTCIFLI